MKKLKEIKKLTLLDNSFALFAPLKNLKRMDCDSQLSTFEASFVKKN